MSYADQVRKYCVDKHVNPARQKGKKEITIIAGQVHSDLGFANRLPLICSALGTKQFENENHLMRRAINGPLNGSRTEFVFDLL